MIKRIALQLVILCSITLSASGQDVPEGFELQEIIRMSEAYRRMPYLSFDVTYQYADTASPTTVLEQMTGQYKLHEGRYWALVDSTELIQGHNYKLAVYHDSKLLAIDRPNVLYTSVLQLSFLDTLFDKRFVDHMHVTSINDSTSKLDVEFIHDAPFTYYEVLYNPISYMVYAIKYYQKDVELDGGSSGVAVISVLFSNYSNAVIDDEYFRESKFIYKDGPSFYPKAAYNDYEVIVSAEF